MVMLRRGAIAAAFFLASLVSGVARADEAPPAHRGFQLALRTGLSLPFGSVTGTTPMSDAFSAQVPLLLDLGWKPFRPFFIGVFVGTALGGAAGQVDTTCQQLGVNCVGVAFRGGILAEWNFRPGERVNPWVGYGFGYELGRSSGSSGSNSISNSVQGFELAHLLAGVDFRLQEYFGIGPFVDGALGTYDIAQSETNQGGRVGRRGGDITDKAMHVWLTLGVRVVLLP
ncbi:MAG: hypothetical protein JWO86_358 [Myxococcaceae bacterium]|nr:hypothetical protein [Myxococcaceae bacterium]